MPVKTSGPDLGKWFVGFVKEVDEVIMDVADQVAELGQEAMRDFIEQRGTSNNWWKSNTARGRRRLGPGRVDTGQMRADIEQFSKRISKTVAVADAGWIYKFEEYYGHQEEGFQHAITGKKIEGMNMMADVADIMVHEAERLIGRKIDAL